MNDSAEAKVMYTQFQRFDHGTRFYWIWGIMGGVASAGSIALGYHARRMLAAGNSRGYGLLALILLLLLFMVVVPPITGFVTEVRRDGLYVRIWPALRTRGMPRGPYRIPLEGLVCTEVRIYEPSWAAGGKTMDCFVARGHRGVYFEFRDGRRLFLGSQEPDELVRWIESGWVPPIESRQ
jgi:hypothetical protein